MRKFRKLYTFFCLIFIFSSAKSQGDTTNSQKTTIIQVDSGDSKPAKQISSKVVKYGTASFYAKKFEGRKTATGEIFRHAYYTAASNFFRLNMWVRVTNLLNGKTAIVRINDRMAPDMAEKGRVIDLTHVVAEELRIISKGIAKVKVEIVPSGTKF